MRRHWQGVIAAVLVAALLIGSGVITMVFAAGNTTPDVSYHLYVTDYQDQDDGTTDMTMELYVYYRNSTNKNAKRGSFGLRFPESIAVQDVKFTPDSANIELFPIYTSTGATYDEWKQPGQHFFFWNVLPNQANKVAQATDPYTDTAFGEEVTIQGMSGGIRMHVGTYTITLRDGFPAGNSIGQLDWLTTDLSQDPLYSRTEDGVSINTEIWNDTDGDGEIAYQGHYQDTQSADGLSMSQVDMPLIFTAPDYWPIVGLTVLSYDPKKNIELTLTDLSGNVVANGFTAPIWSSEDTNMVYAATVDNTDSGIGAYYTSINLDKYTTADGTALSDGGYILEIRKEGHLLQTLPLALTGTSLNEAEGLPEDGGYIYLPPGDVNYVETQDSVDLFGDGRIDMADRSVVMGLLGNAVSTNSGAAYLADIDGDKRVTQADLSILVSPQNYGKYIIKEGY